MSSFQDGLRPRSLDIVVVKAQCEPLREFYDDRKVSGLQRRVPSHLETARFCLISWLMLKKKYANAKINVTALCKGFRKGCSLHIKPK